MNKIIVYCLLVLTYLGLSKTLSPSEFGISYVNSNTSLSELVTGTPVSVILTDIHSTGFLIKTYYHKYRIVYGFQTYDELIVRVSRTFNEEMEKYVGLSVMRRTEGSQSFTPLPPGTVFIGNKNFGRWVKDGSGDRIWKFFRVYRHLPKYLGWETFGPTKLLHEKILLYEKQTKAFFGEENEFGPDGYITKLSFPKYFERKNAKPISFETILKQYIKENFITRKDI